MPSAGLDRRFRAGRFRRLPKAELHLHLEGSLPGAFLRRLGSRFGGPRLPARWPPTLSDFADFLAAFRSACGFLRGRAAIAAAVEELGARLRRERILHAEVFFSPQVHARAGIPYPLVVAALEDGAARVLARGGPSLLFIADGVRQWGSPAFGEMVAAVLDRPSGVVRAVGLGGVEESQPAVAFQGPVARARKAGLVAVVHTGEFGGPASIAQTLDWLAPVRLAHGLRAAEDEGLLRRIVREGVTLDLALTSNARTGAVEKGMLHPLRTLVNRNVRVTLGTDDPALFRTTLSGEFALAGRCGLDPAGLRRAALEAARASLLPDDERSRLGRLLREGWGRGQGKTGGRGPHRKKNPRPPSDRRAWRGPIGGGTSA